MMAVSNSYGTETLKFGDMVGVLLSEEACRKSSGAAETSGSALSVDKERKVDEKEQQIQIQIWEK